MTIVAARPEDVETLTRLAHAAKRHWGYPESWMRQWRDALTITVEFIATHPTFVAIVDGQMIGFSAVRFQADEAWLEHLWVRPDAMSRGVGRALFAHAEAEARRAGARQLKIVGDPHAEGFYRRMGATVYGSEPATMEGTERHLPLLEKAL